MLSIRPKLPKNWKRWRMVRRFPVKISRKFGNCWISETRTIQPRVLKIPWAKLNGKKTFRKFGYTTLRCPALWKFLKIQFYSILEVVETLSKVVIKPEVLVEWKAPAIFRKIPDDDVMSDISLSISNICLCRLRSIHRPDPYPIAKAFQGSANGKHIIVFLFQRRWFKRKGQLDSSGKTST